MLILVPLLGPPPPVDDARSAIDPSAVPTEQTTVNQDVDMEDEAPLEGLSTAPHVAPDTTDAEGLARDATV